MMENDDIPSDTVTYIAIKHDTSITYLPIKHGCFPYLC